MRGAASKVPRELSFERKIMDQSSDAIVRVSAEFSSQIIEMRTEIGRAQHILDDAIGSLTACFQQMNSWRLQPELRDISPGNSASVEATFNQAVLSLQFQDMVTQLLGHVSRRLDVLEELASDETQLAVALRDTNDPDGALRTLDDIHRHVGILSEKLALKQGVSNNPVSQTGFSSGDVELF